MKLTFTSKYALLGGALGYLALHPLVMLSSHVMFEARFDDKYTIVEMIFPEILY